MNKLLIISGPPCSGKTYLIDKLKNNQIVLDNIGFNSPINFVNANQIRSEGSIPNGRTIIHYDCLRSFKRRIKIDVNSDKLLSFVANHDRVSFVFIINPFNIMLTRINERYNRLSNIINASRHKNLIILKELYRNKERFETEYSKWYEFATKHKTASNYIVYNGFDAKLDIQLIEIKGNEFMQALKKGLLYHG